MLSVSEGRVQSEDSGGRSQLSPTCLSIPLVIRKILENCSNSELLQLSLVNKQWNYEARSLMKDRGTMNARLHGDKICESIPTFASRLRQMNVVPYSGIHFHFHPHHDMLCKRWSSEALESSFRTILHRLPLKHLTVSFDGNWENYVYEYGDECPCPAFLLMERSLQENCGVLESLNVRVVSGFEEFISQIIQHYTFPHLKTLKLLRFSRELQTSSSPAERMLHCQNARWIIKRIVSRAPNLQELHLDRPIHGYKNLLQGSSAELVVDSEIDPLNEGICNGLIAALRLTRMRLEYKADCFSMERLNRIVPEVLQTSRTSLHSLKLDSVFAPSLMRYGIPLENVKQLRINQNDQELQVPPCVAADVATFFRVLQDFDFTYIFPKLNKVEIGISSNLAPLEISQFVDQGAVLLQEPTPHRAINIKHLKFVWPPTNETYLARMFPDIEKITVSCFHGLAPLFGLIWKNWVHLKQLVVHTMGDEENWDSSFCGLFPEEIALLRDKDDEYLKAVNIVPVMPSITCMKELTTIIVDHFRFHSLEARYDPTPTFIFSKVTALIAFSRCPNLSVVLKTNSYRDVWSHMKNYPSIVLI